MSVDVRLDNKIRIKDIAVTIPKTLHNDIFQKETNSRCSNFKILKSEELDFSKFILQQHSLIKAWLVISALAIFLLSTLLFSTH